MQEMMKSGQLPTPKIMLQRPGEGPVELSMEDVVKLLQNQQEHIKKLTETIQMQEAKIQELSAQIQDMSVEMHPSAVTEVERLFTPKSANPFLLDSPFQSMHSSPPQAIQITKGKSDPEVFVP
jgi:hypothetical protein